MCKMLLRFLICYLKEKENNNVFFITVYGTMIFPHFDPQYCYDRMVIWKSFNGELSAEFYAHCFFISKITMNSIKTEWPSWPWSYGSWIYTTTYAICAYHLWMLWVRILLRPRCTTLCDQVCQWLAAGRWFSPDTPVSSPNKTDRHDITEILVNVALNTMTLTHKTILNNVLFFYLPILFGIRSWFSILCVLYEKYFIDD